MGVVLVSWLVGLAVSWARDGVRQRTGSAPSKVGYSLSVLALLVLVVPASGVVDDDFERAAFELGCDLGARGGDRLPGLRSPS